MVLPLDSIIPINKESIKLGEDGSGNAAVKSGNVILNADKISKLPITGLEADTEYKLVVFIEDKAGNSTNPHVFAPLKTNLTSSSESTLEVSSTVIGYLEHGWTPGPAYLIDNNNFTISERTDGRLPIRPMLVRTFLYFIVKNHPEQTLKVFSADESMSGLNTPKNGDDSINHNDILEVTSKDGKVRKYKIVFDPLLDNEPEE